MNAQDDNTAPLRTGMRRIIPRFEFRRLGAMARVRIAEDWPPPTDPAGSLCASGTRSLHREGIARLGL